MTGTAVRMRRAATAALLTAGLTSGLVIGASPASAAVGPCWHGTNSWGDGRVAWGACNGTGQFRLVVSCTWGQSRVSNWVYVNGSARTDVWCPYPTKVRWTSVQIH